MYYIILTELLATLVESLDTVLIKKNLLMKAKYFRTYQGIHREVAEDAIMYYLATDAEFLFAVWMIGEEITLLAS